MVCLLPLGYCRGYFRLLALVLCFRHFVYCVIAFLPDFEIENLRRDKREAISDKKILEGGPSASSYRKAVRWSVTISPSLEVLELHPAPPDPIIIVIVRDLGDSAVYAGCANHIGQGVSTWCPGAFVHRHGYCHYELSSQYIYVPFTTQSFALGGIFADNTRLKQTFRHAHHAGNSWR
jgi:hypothetical protein